MLQPKTLIMVLVATCSAVALSHATATAEQASLVGQVTAVDPATSTIAVDGEAYRVAPATRFGGETEKSRLREIEEGMWIQFNVRDTSDGSSVLENPTLHTHPQE